MKTNSIYDGLNRSGINKQAGSIFTRGESFEFENNSTKESLLPLETRTGKLPTGKEFKNLTGWRVGLLTVKGLSVEKGKWVCRCSCGYYVLRSSKAIQNPKNKNDSCFQCEKLAKAKKDYHFKKTGKWLEISEFMGIADKADYEIKSINKEIAKTQERLDFLASQKSVIMNRYNLSED